MRELYSPEFDKDKTATFSPEQRKALEDKGYTFYTLTGKTVASLRDAGKKFYSTWHQGDALEQETSMLIEVAINPKTLFLPKSNMKYFPEQLSMVEEFADTIGDEIPGVTAIIGGVSDYAELTFSHKTATGVRLFGYHYTITTTPVENQDIAIVGHFTGAEGLDIDSWVDDARAEYVWAAPLIIPSSAVIKWAAHV